MKILKKILFQVACIFAIATPITARHQQNDDTQALKNAVENHEPLQINYKKIINPTEISLANPQELNLPVAALTHEQKVAKYGTDKELRDIFHRHAYGLLTEGKIFTSKQALNFFNMTIHEQKAQMQKWLKDHNVDQNNQLKEASKKYRTEIKNFKSSTQFDTLKNVAKIYRAIDDRKDQIKNLKKKIEKGNLSSADMQQKRQELERLTRQNEVDDQSIQTQLQMILEKLEEIDNKFKQECDQVIQNYQEKNYQMLGAVNNIVKSKKQAFDLKTADKHIPMVEIAQPKPNNNPEIGSLPKNPNSVILSESKATLAKNPILDKIIERHEKELLTMSRNNPEYGIIKKELKYLKEARNLRDIQGTAIND